MNRIKQLREEFNFTQQDLADRIDGAKSTIAMYENETRKPSLEVLIKMSEIFDVSIDYLLGKSDIRKSKNINVDDIDIACFDGLRGLNETNKQVAKNIIDGLLAKQQMEEDKD